MVFCAGIKRASSRPRTRRTLIIYASARRASSRHAGSADHPHPSTRAAAADHASSPSYTRPRYSPPTPHISHCFNHSTRSASGATPPYADQYLEYTSRPLRHTPELRVFSLFFYDSSVSLSHTYTLSHTHIHTLSLTLTLSHSHSLSFSFLSISLSLYIYTYIYIYICSRFIGRWGVVVRR